MSEQSTLFGLASEIKKRISEGKFKGTQEDIDLARESYENAIKINRKIGQDLRYGKINKLDYDTQKEDTEWHKNRLNMLEDKPFYFEVDNRFPVKLWGKERTKWRISSKSLSTKSSDQIERLMIGRLKRGLEESAEQEERPKVKEALNNFKESVTQYANALEKGIRPKEIITGTFDFDEPEIEMEITGS